MTVDFTTGELIDRPTYDEVRESIETTKSHLERAAEQVVWQIESQSWLVLGYSSWDEMRESEYKGAAVIVPAADRPELSSRLRSTGLTNRSVAETIGVDERTVRRDLVNRQMPIEVTNVRGQSRPTSYTPKASTPAQVDAVADDSPAISQADVEDVGGVDQNPAPPTATELAESSQVVQDAQYLANFYSAVTKAHEFRRFDAERIGRIGNDEDIRTLELMAAGAAEFLEKAKRARSGLRVIKGGRA